MQTPEVILNLIRNSRGKTTKELIAQCAKVEKGAIVSNKERIMTDYFQLPLEDRFYIPEGPLPSCWGDKLQTWKDWFRRERDARFERFYPREPTWAVHFLMRRAGMEYWLRWLDSFAEDEEIAIFLLYQGNQSHEISDGLETSCKMKAHPHLRSLLFYSLVTDPDVDDSELAQIVYNYPEELFQPCVSILTDFSFTLKQPRRASTMEAVEYICSNDAVYALLTGDGESDKGCLAAQASFLCRTSASKQRKQRFAEELYRWIKKTEKNHLLEDSHGIVFTRETQFLNDTVEILRLLDDAEMRLIDLWRKKTVLYYGWASDTMTVGNGWFQFIGLLLYGIGQCRYSETGDPSLLIRVFDTTNRFIPEALHDREYAVLLSNLLAKNYKNAHELNDLQIKLIQKTINKPLLEGLVKKHEEVGQTDQRVLESFKTRISLLSVLP